MGKSKKPRVPYYNHEDGPARKSQHARGSAGGGSRKMHTFSKLSSSAAGKNDSKVLKQQKGKQDVKITVPFGRKDRILLVGEGEFFFLGLFFWSGLSWVIFIFQFFF